MPKFHVQSPNGQSFIVEGDRPPTEAELNQIFMADPGRKPASAEQFAEPKPTSDGFLANAARNLLPSTTASDYIEGPLQMARHPIDSIGLILSALKDAAGEQVHKAGAAARGVINEPTMRGKAMAGSEMLGHAAAAALPMVGPAAANIGEQAVDDPWGAAGGLTGLLTGMVAPKVVGKIAPRIPGLGKNPIPQMTDAIALAEREGIPVDAATATGRPIMRRIQKRIGDTMGGSGVTERFQRDQSQALKDTGRRLAAKADPSGPSSPETAGQALREGVEGKLSAYAGEADRAYSKLRDIEADPSNTTVIEDVPDLPNPEAPHYFTMKAKPNANDVFLAALEDARNQGYKGTAAELKAKFDDRLGSAKRLREATAEGDDYGDKALLKSIRDLGGLRMFDENYTPGAKTTRFTTEQDNVKGFFKGQRVYTERGLPNDDLVMQLRQDPRWASRFPSDVDMNEVLREIATKKAPPTDVDIQHYLRGEGVTPGSKWWVKAPTETVTVQAPVDLGTVKSALRPVYERMTRQLPITQQRSSPGLKAIENILNGPDHAPLSQVDTDLGIIKGISRGADLPELRNMSQGLAAQAVKVLEQAVQDAAERAGPGAVEARDTGRLATTMKYDAAGVLKKLREEPVQVFNQATFARDAGKNALLKAAALAPEAMPKIGRAYLDDLIDKATREGKFDKAQTLQSAWENLGPETKKILFVDDAYIKDLDSFFRLAKTITENPNTSGTAGQMTAMNIVSAIPLKIVSKMLYSRKGIARLVNGIRLPSGKVAGRTSAFRPRSSAAPAMAAPSVARDQRKENDVAGIR